MSKLFALRRAACQSASLAGLIWVTVALPRLALATDVSGTINSNTTWTLAGSPYVMTNNVTVATGVTLTIQPGVEVRVNKPSPPSIYALNISGALHAEGNPDALIIFTSSLAAPSPGAWYGIQFANSSIDNSCIIKHAVIRYAAVAVDISNASPRIERVTIRDGLTTGIQVNGGAPQILDCFIRDNNGPESYAGGIYLWPGSTPTISGNFIYDNRSGIYTFGPSNDYPHPAIAGNAIFGNDTNWRAISFGTSPPSVTVVAENNFWGVTDSTGIAATIFDNADEPQYPASIDFVPFLSSTPVLVVYDFDVDPTFISPNGDNDHETTDIDATLTRSADWEIRVRNSSNTVVRTLTGTEISISEQWNGRNNANAVVADGAYTVEVFAADSGSSLEYLTEPIGVTVDNTPPAVAITAPTNGATVSGINTISGSANDSNFYTYFVEYGVSASPSSWILIVASQQGVTNGQLASWDARSLTNGTYTLRVSAQDNAGNDASTQVQVTLDNIQITDVSAAPQFFTPGNASTTIEYTLDRAASVTIKIYALNFTPSDLFAEFLFTPQLVATPINNVSMTAGVKTSTWNGRDDSSVLLPFKAYSYSIEAATVSPVRSGYYNPQYVFGPSPPTNMTATSPYDPYRNQVITFGYEIAAPAWVNLKVLADISPDYPTLRDLVTWVPQNSGAHEVVWDGRADDGSLVTQPNQTVGFGQILPDNSVVTQPRSNAVTALTCRPYLFRPIYREITNIQYTIASSAKVKIKVYDPDGTLFETLQDDATPRAAGSYSLEWHGTKLSGLRAFKEGSYRVEVASIGVDNDTVTRSGTVTIYK